MVSKPVLIVSAVGIIVALVACVFALISMRQDGKPAPTATPTVSLDIGAGPTVTPTPAPTSSAEPGLGDGHTEGDGHDHSHGTNDCDSGPVSCEDEDVVRNTAEDNAAAERVRPAVAPFALAWASVDTAESSESRASRLAAAAGSPAVSGQVSALARQQSTQSGLTAKTTGRTPTRILFMEREDGLLKFQVSIDVDARYTQADESGSFRVVGGTLFLYLTDAGAVERVVERFPTISEMP